MHPIFTLITLVSPLLSMLTGVIFLVIYIAELIFYSKHFSIRKKHEEKVAKAETMGHKVTAVLTGSRMYMTNENESKFSPEYYCRYEYVVDGKNYGHVERYTSSPPKEITLYYLDNPKKVFSKNAPADMMSLLLFIITLTIAAIIYFLLLGKPQ